MCGHSNNKLSMSNESPFAQCRNLALLSESIGVCEALELIENKLGVGAWTWEVTTGNSYWTPGIFRLLDLDPGAAEPSRELFEAALHPDDLPLSQDFNKAFAEGVPFDRQFRILRSNGSVRWVRCISEVLVDRAGKPLRAVGVIQDITGQYEALQVEQTWKDRYRALVKATNGVVWSARTDMFRIGYENHEETCGPEEDPVEFLGEGWKTKIHPNDRDQALNAYESAVRSKASFHAEYRVRMATDTHRWFSTRAAPIFNSDGSMRGWIGVCTDIHERRLWSMYPSGSAVTGAQIRGARGILNWSVRDLADKAGLSPAVIRRLEERDEAPGEPEPALVLVKAAFELAGIEFLFPTAGKPGIRPT